RTSACASHGEARAFARGVRCSVEGVKNGVPADIRARFGEATFLSLVGVFSKENSFLRIPEKRLESRFPKKVAGTPSPVGAKLPSVGFQPYVNEENECAL
ncbi:MAG: hypothetical protein ACI4P3_07015, partial [Candidatus Spyradosoma sp.]